MLVISIVAVRITVEEEDELGKTECMVHVFHQALQQLIDQM